MSLLFVLASCTTSTPEVQAPVTASEPLDVLQAKPDAMEGIEVSEMDVTVDDRGFQHTHYQQMVGDVPVFGGHAIVHLNPDGTPFTVTDDLVQGIEVDPTPGMTAEDAIELAYMVYPKGRGTLSEEPVVQLRVYRSRLGHDALAYMVELGDLDSDEPTRPMFVFDAHTGELIETWETLDTYSLADSDKEVSDMANKTSFRRAKTADSSDADALVTYNAIGSTLDYLSTNFGRDSYDGSGAVVDAYQHYGRNYVNAYWDGSRLVFGDGDGSTANNLGVLDITAHEFGHALTDHEANLTYSYESGALNEAWSDILAAVVEADVDGGVTSDTWDLGEDCWLAGSALRYMSHPSDDGSSRDHYSDRYTGSSDNGGVHWNSGIANHWFYLLSEGGQHHDASFASGTDVVGIGIDDAYAISYEALTNYMTASTDFAGARTATESACSALGYATATCDSVSAAWAEVGVGSSGGGGGGGDTGNPDTGNPDTGTGDTGSGGGGSSCPAGYGETTGSLSSGGSDTYTYETSSSGTHSFILTGPSGTDFDLYLGKKKGKNYRTVDSSTSSTSSESITYSGSDGKYAIEVRSYSGSGSYTLCSDLPS